MKDFKIKDLVDGLKVIRDYIDKTAKKHPDKDVRGFLDSILYMRDIIDGILDVFKYFDDVWYNSKK